MSVHIHVHTHTGMYNHIEDRHSTMWSHPASYHLANTSNRNLTKLAKVIFALEGSQKDVLREGNCYFSKATTG